MMCECGLLIFIRLVLLIVFSTTTPFASSVTGNHTTRNEAREGEFSYNYLFTYEFKIMPIKKVPNKDHL